MDLSLAIEDVDLLIDNNDSVSSITNELSGAAGIIEAVDLRFRISVTILF